MGYLLWIRPVVAILILTITNAGGQLLLPSIHLFFGSYAKYLSMASVRVFIIALI